MSEETGTSGAQASGATSTTSGASGGATTSGASGGGATGSGASGEGTSGDPASGGGTTSSGDDTVGTASSGGVGTSTTGGPACDPPWLEIDGVCVPSCGAAGGDTCAPAGSTLCEGLPLLASHDCERCCDGPSYPPPRPVSFHTVHIDDLATWDAILAIYQAHGSTMITSQNRPEFLAPQDWARNIHFSWYPDGPALAAGIHAILVDEATAPHMVLIDELKPDTVAQIAEAATILGAKYPQWSGRWGAYLVNGEAVAYTNLQPAIDALLGANAVIVAEMYAAQSSYCASGGSAGARDVWLGDFFAGEGSGFGPRFGWLAARRNELGSASRLSVLFGVTDTYMNGSSPAIFLDRMFYVWKTRSGHPSALALENGGPGGWKWDAPYTSNTSRDLAFQQSYEHYVVGGAATSLKGQVPCP